MVRRMGPSRKRVKTGNLSRRISEEKSERAEAQSESYKPKKHHPGNSFVKEVPALECHHLRPREDIKWNFAFVYIATWGPCGLSHLIDAHFRPSQRSQNRKECRIEVWATILVTYRFVTSTVQIDFKGTLASCDWLINLWYPLSFHKKKKQQTNRSMAVAITINTAFLISQTLRFELETIKRKKGRGIQLQIK